MKTNKTFFGLYTSLLLASVTAVFAQSPPNNDDFAHRTPLTGSSITFTGTLVGATVEPAETNSSFVWPWPSGRSVWWTWTAAESSAVVIAIQPQSWPNISNAVVFVYGGTNLDALTFIVENAFSKPPERYVRFDATAGTSYQIRVAAAAGGGGVGGPFTLQLTATNPPVFFAQPQNCTVSPYGSAFFSSIATGPDPRTVLWPRPARTTTSYQWYFNGVPLQDETYPCLLLHRVTTNQAGTYSVIASNIGGMTQSDSAILTVVDTNPVPRLAVLLPNNSNLRFNLTGEPGRWYRIESSTNLQDWINPTWLQLTNSTTLISVQRLTPNHFVRAALDVHTDACVGQLKQMSWASQMFGMDNLKSPSDIYGLNDLQPYVPATSIFGTMPFCPDLGVYASGGTLRDPPTCTLHNRGHVITNTP
jgi:hypothetical protein